MSKTVSLYIFNNMLTYLPPFPICKDFHDFLLLWFKETFAVKLMHYISESENSVKVIVDIKKML